MKPRHHLYLDDELTERLEALAAKPGSSKSAIVADALRAYLARRGARELDDMLKVRLDKLSAHLGRIERDLQIVMESLGLFIRFQLMVTAPLPEADQAAARALAQDRFQAFIDQVGRRIAGSRSLSRDILDRTTSAGDVAMSHGYGHPESRGRRRAMLRTAMGPEIAAALADPAVIEVMVNPDGALRLDRLGEGRTDTGARLGAAEVERIIRLVASHVRLEVHAKNPVVSAELPETGERFEGILPPVATAPCFSIRKPAVKVYTLEDYVADRILSPLQAETLKRAVTEQRNLLIAGGTSSGKTTLANALLAEIARLDERVILIEDTRELQCAAPDCVALRTKAGVVTWPISCARPSGSGRTGSSSARSAAPRPSTCSRPGTRAIPAVSPRSMPTRRARLSIDSSSSSRRRSSPSRAG